MENTRWKKMLETLKKRVKKAGKKIIFTEAGDSRILKAAGQIAKGHFGQVILVGNEQATHELLKKNKIPLKGLTIIDPHTWKQTDAYGQQYFESRKDKGVTLEQAKELMRQPNYLGIALVKEGVGDCLVGGASYTTAETMRPALQIIKTKPNVGLASSFFLMILKKKILIFADCSLVRNPSPEELSEIAVNTAKSAAYFGFPAKVAMLSYSTKGSGFGPSVDAVREATLLTQRKMPNVIIDGELQLDAAIVPEVAAMKCPSSPLKGNANILIFPDLNSGNIGYKLVERLSGALALGPFVYGLNKPVSVVSRGATVAEIVQTSIITLATALQPLEKA